MVKIRGISISVISQFDIRRLPEFEGPPPNLTNRSNSVNCCIPIYPGSQIWFEYTIEPPHPPKAAYFFKLLINDHTVTAWDCTEKHGYHGKMIYILEKANTHRYYSGPLIQRKGLKFCNHDVSTTYEDTNGDCMEIRVHRVEHRRRIHDDLPEHDTSLDEHHSGQLQLISGGVLEPSRSPKRYKYQLLDPADEPYAIFRFFSRDYEYLKQSNAITTTPNSPGISSSSLMSWHDACSGSEEDYNNEREQASAPKTSSGRRDTDDPRVPPKRGLEEPFSSRKLSPAASRRYSINTYLPLSDSDESLSVVARDSIEDLSSVVPRSPQSPRSKRLSMRCTVQDSGSPGRLSPSPRQKLKKKLTLDLHSASCSMNRARRPLSPFTSSGFLRRIISPEPNSAVSASAMEPGPLMSEELVGSTGSKRGDPKYTEGGGRSLMDFLSRRGSKRE